MTLDLFAESLIAGLDYRADSLPPGRSAIWSTASPA